MLVQFPYEEHEPLSESYLVKKYVCSRTANGILSLIVLPRIKKVGQELCFMLLTAPMFLSHSNSSSFAQIIKSNVKFYS